MIWKKRRCMHHDNCNIHIWSFFYMNEYLCTIERRIYQFKNSNARLKQGIWTEKGAIYTSFDNNQYINLIWFSVWTSFIPKQDTYNFSHFGHFNSVGYFPIIYLLFIHHIMIANRSRSRLSTRNQITAVITKESIWQW